MAIPGSVGDDHQHATGSVLDQRTRDRAAPPAGRPAVQVLVADDDEVGLDLAGVLGDFLDRFAGHNLAPAAPAGFFQPAQAVFEHAAVLLLLAFFQFDVVD